MKKINHNIKPSLKSTLIFCGICAVMVIIGKVNYTQNQQIKELRQQQEKQIAIQKQSKIDSAIYYVDLNADLGDAMDIKFYINEASNIYNLDSVQIVAVSNEYYLD
jgi:hypothetical protein